MKIYVGNLSAETSARQVRAMFEPHGPVKAARLVKDKDTGAPRGYAIVEMEDAEARTAITALRGCSHSGRTLKVREARLRPKPDGFSPPEAPAA